MEREREREEDAIVWKIVREGRREMESGGRVYAWAYLLIGLPYIYC